MIRSLKTRVVISGLGVVAPNGNHKTTFWLSLLSKQSGIGKITLFDTSNSKTHIAGEVKDFDLHRYLTRDLKLNRMARHTQFAIGGSIMAMEDAKLTSQGIGTNTLPIVLGVSYSALEILEKQMFKMFKHGPNRVSPHVIGASTPQSVASSLSALMEVDTEAITISTACGAGIDAIATAVDMIRSGRTDIAISGGADAPITEFALASFSNSGMVGTYDGDPKKANRPFDINRTSGILSEGCGIVVLENYDHARARGVNPYAEITGYGNAMDRSDSFPGNGLSKAMQKALANAGLRPQEIDYISAHGSGDRTLDVSETAAIKKALGSHAYSIPVSSIKGVIGNPLSAAGPLQVISCAQAFRTGFIPPTANHSIPDPQCDLDYVSEMARKVDLNAVLINAHGVGGGNSSLILQRLRD